MKSKDLETRMRRFEAQYDQQVLPNTWAVIRVDGKGFTSFLKKLNFRRPFDPKMIEIMADVTEKLVDHFQAVYGYVESDEISILLPKSYECYNRKTRKIISHASAVAAATFTNDLLVNYGINAVAVFDARVLSLPSLEDVVDYFSWRQADASRCCLNTYCHWTAIQTDKLSAAQATKLFMGRSVEFKHEYLFKHGINYNDLPTHLRRGIGVFYEQYQKCGWNPITKQEVWVERKRLYRQDELPMKLLYTHFIEILADYGYIDEDYLEDEDD